MRFICEAIIYYVDSNEYFLRVKEYLLAIKFICEAIIYYVDSNEYFLRVQEYLLAINIRNRFIVYVVNLHYKLIINIAVIVLKEIRLGERAKHAQNSLFVHQQNSQMQAY